MPRLLMIRKPWAETLILIHFFIVGTKKRWTWMFGNDRVFVLLLAWLTLFPTNGRFPVTWQTLLMAFSLPARLDDAGDLPGERHLAERDARHLEVAQRAARTSGDQTAVGDANRVRIAGELRERFLSLDSLLGRGARAADRGLERRTLLRVLRHELLALLVLVDLAG